MEVLSDVVDGAPVSEDHAEIHDSQTHVEMPSHPAPMLSVLVQSLAEDSFLHVACQLMAAALMLVIMIVPILVMVSLLVFLVVFLLAEPTHQSTISRDRQQY